MANYFARVIITGLYISVIYAGGVGQGPTSTPANDPVGHWDAEVKHDPAGGALRVSGDGPKSKPADPLLDIGSSSGKNIFLTEEQIRSHPNFKYLSPLAECGHSTFLPAKSSSGGMEDDLIRGKDDKGMDSGSEEEEKRSKRIVGGKPVRARRHPWMVQLYLVRGNTGEHFFHCAGTIISNITILTAAHCITRIQAGTSLDIAVVGTEDRRLVRFCKTSNTTENCTREMIRSIGEVEVHRNYSEGNLKHDIGLIYLKTPLQFSDNVRPICLPHSEKLLSSSSWSSLRITAVGWGSTNKYKEGYNSALLKEVEVDLQPRQLCDVFHVRIYGKTGDDRICTGGNSDRATCNGDSGGGIMKALQVISLDSPKSVESDKTPTDEGDDDEEGGKYDENGVKEEVAKSSMVEEVERVFQFGIISAGGHVTDTCGFQGRATIDTSVIFYMDWILNHIVPGAHAYHFVKHNDSSHLQWQRANKSLAGNGSQEDQYKTEFSTGDNVDVSHHPNIRLLPSLNTCGNRMASSPHPKNPTSVSKEHPRTYPQATAPWPTNSDSASGEELEVNRRKRIVGGVPTGLENYFPWMAQVYVRNVDDNGLALRCSGTIITSRHILTAAHCVTEIAAPFAFDRIIVGQYNRNSTEECIDDLCYHHQEVLVADTIIHAEYEKYTQRNNLAIVRLAGDLKFTAMVQPICLPRRELLMEGFKIHKYFTSGWGRMMKEEDGKPKPDPNSNKLSEILLQTNVHLRPRSDCDFVYSRAIYLLERSRLCGGGQAAKGECIGDGGSPLMKKLELEEGHPLHDKIFQLGLVAFMDCGMQGMPTVYLNIISYMGWILDNLGDPDSNAET